MAGPADDERSREGRLIHHPLVEPAMLAQEETLVRGVDDDRVLAQSLRFEVGEQPADVLVHRGDARQVTPHEVLIRPLAQVVRGQVLRDRHLQIAFLEVLADAHLDIADLLGATLVVVEQRRRFGDLHVLVQVLETRRRVPRPVRRLEMAHQVERLVLVTLLEKVDRQIGDDILGVAVLELLELLGFSRPMGAQLRG